MSDKCFYRDGLVMRIMVTRLFLHSDSISQNQRHSITFIPVDLRQKLFPRDVYTETGMSCNALFICMASVNGTFCSISITRNTE